MLLVLLVLLAAALPDPVPLGAVRLLALGIGVTGTWLLIGRIGAVDLAAGAVMAAGAYLGGVGSALLGLPALVGLPMGVVAGAIVGAASGALHGRVGRELGALGSLALAGGLLAVAAAFAPGGGVAGFHAVGLLVPAGTRAEVLLVGGLLLAALHAARRLAATRWAAAAAVAVRAPVAAASLGRRPVVDVAVVGAGAGSLLGLAGATLAALDGSVLPAAYGLGLTAALALAALLGGAAPLGPVLGTALVWGPGTLLPLVPLVGTAPPLLLLGPVGLAVLAARRGRPLIASTSPAGPDQGTGADPDAGGPCPPGAAPARLEVRGLPTPSGPLHLEVRPGEVVALTGPNGAGKSTALAAIAGQHPDHGTVWLGGRALPAGSTARARAGIARTWQQPPDLPRGDAAVLATDGPEARAARRWVDALLDPDDDPAGREQVLRLVARRPVVALLDEPTAVAATRLLVVLRGLAAAGAAVVVVDHRPEVVAGADREVRLTGQVRT